MDMEKMIDHNHDEFIKFYIDMLPELSPLKHGVVITGSVDFITICLKSCCNEDSMDLYTQFHLQGLYAELKDHLPEGLRIGQGYSKTKSYWFNIIVNLYDKSDINVFKYAIDQIDENSRKGFEYEYIMFSEYNFGSVNELLYQNIISE